MNGKDAQLHYRRLILQFNKMYDSFFNGKKTSIAVGDYYNNFAFTKYQYYRYDLNSMLLLCSVALMGLNKEMVEKSSNYKNYKYLINYTISNYDDFLDVYMKQEGFPINQKSYIENCLKKGSLWDFFNKKSNYPNEFSEWLKVESRASLDNFNWNYLYCVRNAFMHSLFSPKETRQEDGFSSIDFILDIENDKYKNFKAKIFLTNFLDFINFYYSNTAFYGINSCSYQLAFDDEFIKKTNSEEELINLINNLYVKKLEINNKSIKPNKTFEYKVMKDRKIYYEKGDSKNGFTNTLTEHEKDILITIIRQYYNDKFYKLDMEDQHQLLFFIVNYIKEPKIIITANIIAIYENVMGKFEQKPTYRTFGSGEYALEPSVLLLKCYTVLYRIQNKCFESIDYNKMNLVKFDYSEFDPYHLNLYNEYKKKLIAKGVLEDEETYQKMYFTEIFRDALAHGNISIDFSIIDGKLHQKLVFNDIYKNKTRTIKIELSELNAYLSSDCFKRQEAIIKDIKEDIKTLVKK